MPSILIVESNSPALCAEGRAAASGFVRAFLGLAPETKLRVCAPYAEAMVESDLDGIDGAVFTGSGVVWSTDAREAAPLRDAMERVFDAGLPTWGSCNGLQLAAVVLGGAVGHSPSGMEIGLAREIAITDEGARHAMLNGRKAGYAVPCVHRDEVIALPSGASLLAGNAHSPVQAMAYEAGGIDFWGTQYHPEMTLSDVADCADESVEIPSGSQADMRQAETDERAADRLGTTISEQSRPVRLLELRNWLDHVKTGHD